MSPPLLSVRARTSRPERARVLSVGESGRERQRVNIPTEALFAKPFRFFTSCY
jgi:hypothetical protein